MFHLGLKSLKKQIGVDGRLILVNTRAIQLCHIDYATTEGVRSQAAQDAILAEQDKTGIRKTKTKASKHLIGHAIHNVPYGMVQNPIQPGAVMQGHVLMTWGLTWDQPKLFDDITCAMRQASIELEIPIRWGGFWFGCLTTDHIDKPPAELRAMQHEVYKQRGQKPFDDLAHFELMI